SARFFFPPSSSSDIKIGGAKKTRSQQQKPARTRFGRHAWRGTVFNGSITSPFSNTTTAARSPNEHSGNGHRGGRRFFPAMKPAKEALFAGTATGIRAFAGASLVRATPRPE